jgi:hypothetical protein
MAEKAEHRDQERLSDEELRKRVFSNPKILAQIDETRKRMREPGPRRIMTIEELRLLLLDDT